MKMATLQGTTEARIIAHIDALVWHGRHGLGLSVALQTSRANSMFTPAVWERIERTAREQLEAKIA